MVLINSTFNSIFVFLGLIGMVSKSLNRIQYVNKLSCLMSTIYFPYDSYLEIKKYKRFTFIPHHIIALLISYVFYFTNDIKIIKSGPILLFCAEGTSLLLNLRIMLKNNNKLTKNIDSTFLFIYLFLRNMIMTPILYTLRYNKLLWYSWLLIFVMSNVWGLKWYKNIIKYYN
ncbi:hypothetical protein CL656_01620 [bacterium]|nr:hypothetical protein [bacterium]|tara:strand:+ start:1430 stop:1945 length:516 start_codon:yes stop_codon:yes gene_type:complete